MHAPLVVVRWHGDVIATHDAFPLGLEGAPEGVTVEVVDVSAERAALRLRPAISLVFIASLLASVVLHLGFGAGMIVAASLPPGVPPEGVMPPQNDQAGPVTDPAIKIAARESAPEPPKEVTETPPKEEEQPPAPTAERAEEIPALVDEEASAAHSPPEEIVPAEVAPEGSGGEDELTSSPTACVRARAAVNHGPKCRRSVVFTALQKSPSCYVDTVAQEGQSGTLTFPCDGDGEATLRFGKKAFVGAVVDGKVDVCTGTEYPFSDGCKWTSAQRVTGSVGNGELHFTYGEAPKAGQQNCAMRCGATATVVVGALPR